MQATEPEFLTLTAGPLELVLSPAIGGSIARFEFSAGERRIPILRGCPSAPRHALETGCFPLVPYVNRIRGGQFTFRGKTVRLARNMVGEPNPLHGQGWLNPWRIVTAAPNEATLEFSHAAGEWPWSYLARQEFKLADSGLDITLRCRNQSADPMPCGLGQHPYFPCSAQTRLRTQVEHVWTIDEHVLPLDRVAASGRYDLADRAVCGLGLDHGYGGWGGIALLSDPQWPFDITMSSSDAAFFQLYSPASSGLFVAEPLTHANAALNAPEQEWAGLGMRILMPGEEMALSMRLEIA